MENTAKCLRRANEKEEKNQPVVLSDETETTKRRMSDRIGPITRNFPRCSSPSPSKEEQQIPPCSRLPSRSTVRPFQIFLVTDRLKYRRASLVARLILRSSSNRVGRAPRCLETRNPDRSAEEKN